ncbi:hypothetical protein FF098_003775 [Parvularcula flava]|uniref:Lipoprotein n=1 Tax=Aquisalinus luteolus TaxID=1566827 RepID=A0A8J3EP40_9PROT|nr:hypothetical protein [Aquisalinus luteolus]NHK27022.1 hypothetical protein [Aquisalinus luteolus]GGH94127.1 hypothetical protein GCM10011355_07580 [Aquisalinus luteolus]
MRFLAIALSLFALSACTSMPLSTMWQMRNADPLSMDPAEIRVAARVPEHYNIAPGQATMSLSVERDRTKERVAEEFTLAQTDIIDSPRLEKEQKDGHRILTFWIAEKDRGRVRQFQNTAKRWKTETPGEVRGEMSLTVQPCLEEGKPLGQVRVSSYIQMQSDADFMVLTKDLDLTRQYDVDGLTREVKTCPDAS